MMKRLLKKIFTNAKNPRGIAGAFMLRRMKAGHRKLWDKGFSLLSIPEGAHILDIGCGNGDNIKRVLETVPGSSADGLDPSEVSVKLSKKTNEAYLGERCMIRQGTADSLPYQSGALDLVTAFETVYFWGDLIPAFKEIFRVLKPGGKFLICCNASDPEDTTWTGLIKGMKVFRGEDLKMMLEEARFGEIMLHRCGKQGVCLVAEKY